MKISGNPQWRETATCGPVWENVVGALAELYRGQGYVVEPGEILSTGASADGFDLRLRKDEHIVLVQCTQAGAKQLPHNHVHRLLGAVVKQGATAAVLVSDGEFTDYARTSAAKLGHIQLIDGTQLQAMLGDAYAGSPSATDRRPSTVVAARPRLAAVAVEMMPEVAAAPAVPPEIAAPPVATTPLLQERDAASITPVSDDGPRIAAPAHVPTPQAQGVTESPRDAVAASAPLRGTAVRFGARKAWRNVAKPSSRLTRPLACVLACAVAMWTMQGAMGSFESSASVTVPSAVKAHRTTEPDPAPKALAAPSPVGNVPAPAAAPVAAADTAQSAGKPEQAPADAAPGQTSSPSPPASVKDTIASTSTSIAAGAVPDIAAAPAFAISTPDSASVAQPAAVKSTLPARVEVATLTPRRMPKKSAASGLEDEVRDHERRNAEAMRVLEKNTPAIGYGLPQQSGQ